MKSDEIINSLLRTNFENIKDVDESLDIDLSVCATIPNCNFPSDLWALEGVDFLNSSNQAPIICNGKQQQDPLPSPSNQPKTSHFSKIKIEKNIFKINKTDDNIQVQIEENTKKLNVKFKDDIMKFKYKCEECAVIYENVDELSMVKHDTGHTVTLICDECDKECENEIEIKKHFKTHKNGIRRSALMECPDCGKCLKLGSMWMHRKIHTNSRQFNCDICGQKFVQKINLTQHLKLHNTEKPFECPECLKTFPEKSHMLRHQKYHSDQRPYRCEKCGKMYKTERCLKVHSLVHLDQRPFVCNVCNKSFLSNSKLKQHSNIHTGERPYKCNYCSRDFTNFPNWLKHTRRRHNVDHKTGEILQNIPSYCSKQRKLKKPTSGGGGGGSTAIVAVAGVSVPVAAKKTTSDRKPKVNIKKEILEDVHPFNETKIIKLESKSSIDLHCLSITSAEDLIMEQALEMEEAAYFNNNKNCDNGVPQKLDFINRDIHFYNALSSIESSPLSSPASEFQSYITTLPPITTMNSNNFFRSASIINNNSPSQQVLPSMDTFFSTGYQKAQSNM